MLGLDGVGIRINGSAKSQGFADHYSEVAKELDCQFFDVGSWIESSPVDGVHLSAESHQILGKAMAEVVARLAKEKKTS